MNEDKIPSTASEIKTFKVRERLADVIALFPRSTRTPLMDSGERQQWSVRCQTCNWYRERFSSCDGAEAAAIAHIRVVRWELGQSHVVKPMGVITIVGRAIEERA
jgi:hypothetical protein